MWPALIPILGKVLDNLFPDPTKAAEAKLRLIELEQQGALKTLDAEVQLALAQITTNQEEAKSASLFVSGWRPAVGWTCVAALAWNFIGYPIANWVAAHYAPGFTPPPLLADNLMELILGMLGLAGLRSWEKRKGVAAK